jgi:5-methylcytosine-specific restriction enzyme A
VPTIKLQKRQRDNVPTRKKGEYQEIYQDKRWKQLRNAKMKANPLCERCESVDDVVPMQEVHHKIPFNTGKTRDEVEALAFSWDNLESLCESCHEERHKQLK